MLCFVVTRGWPGVGAGAAYMKKNDSSWRVPGADEIGQAGRSFWLGHSRRSLKWCLAKGVGGEKSTIGGESAAGLQRWLA